VTVGNCADVRPAELLEHFFQSDKFRVIGLYLETAMGGRQLFEVLRKYKNTKPVVLLKGGSTSAGQIAAISHTGALAGSQAAWKALEAQTNLITASTLNEFLDILLALQCLGANGVSHENLILFGNGGGTSVLGADAFARQGFRLANLSSQSLNQLSALNLPAGSSIANPIDVPAGALQQDEGRIAGKILKALVQTSHALTIVHINMTVVTSFEHVDMLGNIIESFMNLQATQLRDGKIALVLRSDGDPAMEQTKLKYRQMAIEAGTPVFDELADAAIALGAIRRSRFNRAS
jgi:acyl-CoA synthetase (NDP forming)